MSSWLPIIKLPIGHPMPLLKQKFTVSKSLTISEGSTFRYTVAFKARAPSKCNLILC